MDAKFQKSNELLKKAKKLTPLGAQTFSKSYRYFCEGHSPAFLEKGDGCYVWDIDGNKYIDFMCALGAVTIGYNDPRINSAIIEQLKRGISFSLPSKLSIDLAEKLTQIIPGAEMVRFVKNGSDATSAAVRLARAYTGRDIVAASGYHGMQDWYIGSTVNHKGIPKPVRELTQSFEYNNLDSLKALFGNYPQQIAAVILEPIQGDGPENDFLSKVKELVQSEGAILIFDEVVSGFRYALGGAAELYDVTPDLAAFGKGMANGMPISVVSGRRDIIDLISDGVFISITFGDEALSIAAALETIKILEQSGAFKRFWQLGERMLDGIKNVISKYDLSNVMSVSGLAPHCGVVFEGYSSLDYLDITSIYQQKMSEKSILTTGINNLNLSHSEMEIDRFIAAVEEAAVDIRKALEQDSLYGILKGGKVNPVFKRNIR